MTLQVLHPVARQIAQEGRTGPRLGVLEGKVIGLYWNHKPGGDAALRRAGELLRARYAGLETKEYEGSIGSANRYVTPDDVRRIAREVSAVIGSTAD